MCKIFALLLVIIAVQHVSGLNELSAKGDRCLLTPPTLAKDFDIGLIKSVDEWYFPYGSRLEYYRTAAEILKRPVEEIKEDDLYYNGCFKVKWPEGEEPYGTGFGGQRTGYFPAKPGTNGGILFQCPYLKMEANVYITFSDNKTFYLLYTCYEDGEATWAVRAKTKSLSKATVKKIHEHVKSLGFSEKHFVQMRMESCDWTNDKEKKEL
jgi:hypothetical protein